MNTAEGTGPARKAFLDWSEDRSRPLDSTAYALLSNWFLTEDPDARRSKRGYEARRFWDALFVDVPIWRLTDPKHNSKILKEPFKAWWVTQEAWQEYENPS